MNAGGEIARLRGDLAAAESLLERSIALGRGLTSPFVYTLGLGFLGRVRLDQGRLEEAEACFEEARRDAAAAGINTQLSCWLCGLGEVAERRGDMEASGRLYREAVATAEQIVNERDAVAARQRLASLTSR